MKLTFFNTCQLPNSDIEKTARTLLPYLKHLQMMTDKNNYDFDESSINLPFDEKSAGEVKKLVNKLKTEKLKYIVDIGIGGSNLGTKAVYDALFGYFDIIQPNRYPKMIFLDTNDPEFITRLVKLLKGIKLPEEIVINAISKSGGTTETITNLEIVLASVDKTIANARLVVTSDKGSSFWNLATEKNIPCLEIPKMVGGRYSVLSPVGLFPLMMAGLDVDSVLAGARSMRNECLSESVLANPALISATILFLHNTKGININDNFFFHPELESVGKWYRQLMGESIGKDGKGITPTVSIGSTDLHSVGQLYFGGPKDKVTTIISAPSPETIAVSGNMMFPLVAHVEGKKFATVIDAICQGVAATYNNLKLPYMKVVLDDLSEKSLGEFLQFKMIEMMFLGKLLGINAFNQPHVELYKVETKKILSQ